eukprot:CAMPEP_0174839706 /NCGR_PEP_ID=MMETSP1114-20130205/8217_1 /TAXON_ID=312471 /ORGANISM="Neobodo designis, Strain CCAP 1951/1" /LENGTH=101 /DNA_ID=CAMNT_0016073833 /DNA_START=214 /DNA_END=520 /DNA_ORIENTATION=+
MARWVELGGAVGHALDSHRIVHRFTTAKTSCAVLAHLDNVLPVGFRMRSRNSGGFVAKTTGSTTPSSSGESAATPAAKIVAAVSTASCHIHRLGMRMIKRQ